MSTSPPTRSVLVWTLSSVLAAALIGAAGYAGYVKAEAEAERRVVPVGLIDDDLGMEAASAGALAAQLEAVELQLSRCRLELGARAQEPLR